MPELEPEVFDEILAGLDRNARTDDVEFKYLPASALKWISVLPSCKKAADEEKECNKKHCPVCGKHYKMQVFNYPGPCNGTCQKKMKGQTQPAGKRGL